jgi:hypothetical protein
MSRNAILAAAIIALGITAATSADAQFRRGQTPSLTLFSEPHMNGSSRVVTSDIASVRDIGFEDRTVSLVAVGRWEVCHGRDFRGDCRIVEGEVRDLGPFANGISSVRLVGGWGFSDPGYGNPGGPGWGNPGWGNPGGPGPAPGIPGWGQYSGQSVRGSETVFFPGRISDPRCRPGDRNCSVPADQRAADGFCRAQGLSQAVYFSASRRGSLTDVLCR